MFRQRLLPAVLLALGLGVFLLLWPARRLRSENLVIYLPNQCKLIPIQRVGSTAYLPLLPLLNLHGPVAGIEEKRNSLKVWVGGSQLQFHLNSGKVRVNNNLSATMPEPVLRVNGEWMVPEVFLSGVLPQLTGGGMTYEPGSNRAFLGGVHPISYAVRLQGEPSGAQLVIQFTGPVTAESASRNGKWLVFLRGAAVQPLEPVIRFNDPYIKELQFDDQDGQPKLIITPGEPNLNFYPVLTADHRELVLDFKSTTAKAPSATLPASPTQLPLATHPATGAQAAASAAQPTAPAPPPLPVIVLDAGHGGADSGARSMDGILEKNLVASLVAQVSSALQSSQRYRVVLCRAGDSDPSIEDRTATANTARPAAFLTFHAGEMGSQSPAIRVYTYEPSDPAALSGEPPAPALFVPWESAQMPELGRSKMLAADLAQQFSGVAGAVVPAPISAPVRQLRSITAPAVAIELGSLAPTVPAGALNQPAFQQQVAKAAAAAIEAFAGGPAKP